MVIFEKRRTRIWNKLKLWIPALFLIVVCSGFLFSINEASEETLKKQQESLANALQRGAVHTYSLEGRYPENLEQLLETYHITYDKQQFVVEYVPNGSNLFPMISVIPLTAKKGEDG